MPKPESVSAGSGRIPISPLRRIAFHVLSIAFGGCRALFPPRTSAKNTVVFVEPYGMGDILALQPAARALVAAGYSVTIIAQPQWRSLVPEADWTPTERPWTELPLSAFFREIRRLSSVVPADGFAFGLDPRGDIRSLILLAALRCTEIISFDHYVGCDLRVNLPGVRSVPDTFADDPKWQLNFRLASAVRDDVAPPNPPIGDFLLTDPVPPKMRAALIVTAPWDGKSWPADHWTELAARCAAGGLEPVVICGPGQTNRARQALPNEQIPIFEAANLNVLAVELAKARVVVSLDSGPMHLAAALGRPVVALFGIGQIPLWAPAGSRSAIVSSPSLGHPPLHQTSGNALAGQRAMAQIPVDQVWRAVVDLLKE